eukprot:TRINITY_DN77115_c0_g1_i1.p1 TRINITY_DN77115_c0_g1~~TRINITY_DN77115_c0_g1_i1.p1  ORF type:complete len:793 (-),score=134.64 TRINITY_DN77115_c0_g1_i1:66-2363(-)
MDVNMRTKSFQILQEAEESLQEEKIPHRVFYWVKVRKGHDCEDFDGEALVEKLGVPVRLVLSYWNSELQTEAAVKNLPRALFLVFCYAMMMLSHEAPSPVQSIEKAIDFDIIENANFAFGGEMGHKNYEDVNSYADFWSWMNLGFSAIYFPEGSAVSEDSTLQSVALSEAEASRYLWHNAKIGPVKLSKQVLKDEPCPSTALAGLFGMDCNEPGGHFLQVEPTVFAIETGPYIEDTASTVYLPPWDIAETKQKLVEAEKDKWLDENTYHVEITFLTYSGSIDALTRTSVHFLFPRSGHIYKKITNETFIMHPYDTPYIVVFEALFVIFILSILLEELFEVCKGLFRQRNKPLAFLWGYFSFWNAVDWLSISLAITIIALWILQMLYQVSLEDDLTKYQDLGCGRPSAPSACQEAFPSLIRNAEVLGLFVRRANMVQGFYPVAIMLRLFKAFSKQARLAVVVRTMEHSAGDLAHFAIVFSSIFFTYAFMGVALFGRACQEFATFPLASLSLFSFLMGDFELDDMLQRVGRPIGFIYFSSYMLTAVMLLLNMLIAIIMDVYAESKAAALSSEPVWQDYTDLFRRTLQNWRRERVPLDKAIDALLKAHGEEAMESEEVIQPKYLMDCIPNFSEKQARRACTGAANKYAKLNGFHVSNHEILNAVHFLHGTASLDHEPRKSTQGRAGLPAKLPEFSAAQGSQQALTEEEATSAVAALAKHPLQLLLQAAELRIRSKTVETNPVAQAVSTLLCSASSLCAQDDVVREALV